MRNRNNTGRPIARRAEQFTNLPVVKEPAELMTFLMEKGGMSRNKAKSLLTHRVIFVDKKITTQYNFELKPGMLVQVSKSHNHKEFKSQQVKLVYEDAYIIVVDKREGVPAVGSEKKRERTVFSILDDYVKRSGKQHRIYGIHRLDREASGLMIFAKDERTKQNLLENWDRLVTERAYVAILNGEMEKDKGVISSWLANDQLYVAHAATNNTGEKAVTHYTTIKRANGYTLVELDLGSGHREQIRLHMQELGHPIVGDNKYDTENNPLSRMAMHAFYLSFHHPVTGEFLKFETPYPANFSNLFTPQ
ncbi:MAG: RluA family pseudouridine synthase [Bacteroidaceae bacterium]|nr:RluA family pseudouridine synthase [Bacteroidaceae bacterium]